MFMSIMVSENFIAMARDVLVLRIIVVVRLVPIVLLVIFENRTFPTVERPHISIFISMILNQVIILLVLMFLA